MPNVPFFLPPSLPPLFPSVLPLSPPSSLLSARSFPYFSFSPLSISLFSFLLSTSPSLHASRSPHSFLPLYPSPLCTLPLSFLFFFTISPLAASRLTLPSFPSSLLLVSHTLSTHDKEGREEESLPLSPLTLILKRPHFKFSFLKYLKSYSTRPHFCTYLKRHSVNSHF